jgi:hypothetical protein
MGFLASEDTVTVTAKLTPFGRRQLLTNSSSVITHFGLGDSDANYLSDLQLDNGEVPALAGEVGVDNIFSNGVYEGVSIKSPIIVNSSGDIRKLVESGSATVNIKPTKLGQTTILGSDTSGNTISQFITDRRDVTTDSYVNLFKSFGLPLTQDERNLYSSFNNPVGYLDTAIRNINQNKVLVIAIDKCAYGEILDGREIKIELETTGGTEYTIYSTFQRTLTPATSSDSQIKESAFLGSVVGSNVAFLFSDEVERPNENPRKSWATGFGQSKPFSINGKEKFNALSVSSVNQVADNAVGVAYLDKGFIVITNPDIVNNYDTEDASADNATVTYNHLSNEISQNITCVVERDEFANTNNSTFNNDDLIKVSEVALYDTFNNVIAYAKSNEHLILGANQYLALGVRILV